MFSHNGVNEPKSSTTSFRQVCQAAALKAKSDIYNCLA